MGSDGKQREASRLPKRSYGEPAYAILAASSFEIIGVNAGGPQNLLPLIFADAISRRSGRIRKRAAFRRRSKGFC